MSFDWAGVTGLLVIYLIIVLLGLGVVLLVIGRRDAERRRWQRLELRSCSYAEAEQLLRLGELPGGEVWRLAEEEDGNRLLNIVYLERVVLRVKSTSPLWVVALVVLLAGAPGQPVSAGGDQWDLPQGGDCWQFSDTPTNEKQKRVMTERGWRPLPLVKKHEVGAQVARGEAEWLLVSDDKICGATLGEQRVYASWYWRPVTKKRR